jgi:4-hydroxy-3-polyprenylbenzoate decarboxylase
MATLRGNLPAPLVAPRTLRDFLAQLEKSGQLKRITAAIDPKFEITEVCDRTLRCGGPALLFERPTGNAMPVLANLFGTPERITLAMGRRSVAELRELGDLLGMLREPEPPARLSDVLKRLGLVRSMLQMPVHTAAHPPCQAHRLQGDAVDLSRLPVLTCWPEDAEEGCNVA